MNSKIENRKPKIASDTDGCAVRGCPKSSRRISSFAFRPHLILAALPLLLLTACTGGEPAGPRAIETRAAARLERGRYLTENVALCLTCHSEVDWKSAEVPIVPGTNGSGGPFPETSLPFPLNVPNITPDPETGAGRWTDRQIARAIREGIGYDGRVLFPGMPYPFLRQMSDDDLAAVIAYLRSLPPVRKPVARTPLPPEVQQSLQPMPITGKVAAPDFSDPLKRGAYMTSLALCADCHTPLDERGQPIQALAFSGGRVLVGPWGTVASANITPDPSGIAHYDEALFLKTMHTGNPGGRQLNPIMLTSYFRHMTDDDLNAIFAYLRTLKPVAHRVDNTEPPTDCRLCRQKHGYGNRN